MSKYSPPPFFLEPPEAAEIPAGQEPEFGLVLTGRPLTCCLDSSSPLKNWTASARESTDQRKTGPFSPAFSPAFLLQQ